MEIRDWVGCRGRQGRSVARCGYPFPATLPAQGASEAKYFVRAQEEDGSEVRYLQLAHNVWDPQKPRSTAQVVYNFGREDAARRCSGWPHPSRGSSAPVPCWRP